MPACVQRVFGCLVDGNMALVAVGGESVAGDKKQPACYSDCSMCGDDSWMLQLVSDAPQPVADAACDAAVRGIMTSLCG